MDGLLEDMVILLILMGIVLVVAYIHDLFKKKNITINAKPIIIGVVVVLIVGIVVSCSMVSGNRGGDGKNTCKNCGRSTSLVPGYGYCIDCYEGFTDWQEDYYKDN